MKYDIREGDCLDALRAMPDASIDSIVTDPPYGLGDCSPANVAACLRAWVDGDKHEAAGGGFMGRAWDSWVPGPEVWRECRRVLKPGGHLLAFAGSRTVDLMGMAIRLGGFEIRDSLQWIMGSGFPKSLNVSKAIDKAAGVEREVIGYDATRARPNRDGQVMGDVAYDRTDNGATLTAPATDEAKQWDGWGSALKPSHEPVLVARKPLGSTIAACVLKHGTGAVNVDGCRVATDDETGRASFTRGAGTILGGDRTASAAGMYAPGLIMPATLGNPAGRWPPNVLLQHAHECEGDHNGRGCVEGCAVGVLGLQSGASVSSDGGASGATALFDSAARTVARHAPNDSGTAARFFPSFRYVAKASAPERDAGVSGPVQLTGSVFNAGDGPTMRTGSGNERTTARANTHATVKPVEVMRWLVRLVTPPGGVVLDPFCGSGTTGCAAMVEGFEFIGCEREPEYARLSRERVAWWAKHGRASVEAWGAKRERETEDERTGQVSMFGD